MKKEELKRIVKNCILLKPIYQIYKKIVQKMHCIAKEKGKDMFIKNSSDVMEDIQNLFSNYHGKIGFFFGFGTLLGIIRDKKLLSGDMDLDLVVFLSDDSEIDKFRAYLKEYCFKRLYSCKIKEIGISQDAFLYKDVMVDINYAKKVKDKYCNYLFYDLPEQKNKIVAFPFSFTNSKLHEFENHYINVPDNPEHYLEETYGKDWKIPNPNYVYWENPQSIKTELIGEIELLERFKYS